MTETHFTLPAFPDKALARFWSKVRIGAPDECWEWTSGKDKDGYGGFSVNSTSKLRKVRASRIAYFLTFGPFLKKLFVCHTCDNPSCTNPAHFFLGNALINNRDAKSKGRNATGDRNGSRLHPESRPRGDRHGSKTHPECVPRGDRSGSRKHPERLARGDRSGARTHPEKLTRGERCHSSKLTEQQVVEIRARFATGGATKTTLSKEFGVSLSNIIKIIRRLKWKHVP